MTLPLFTFQTSPELEENMKNLIYLGRRNCMSGKGMNVESIFLKETEKTGHPKFSPKKENFCFLISDFFSIHLFTFSMMLTFCNRS